MIEEVTDKNIEEILPLIEEYQIFYGAEQHNDEKNKLFFLSSQKTMRTVFFIFIGLRQKAIGFTTIYTGFSSARAEAIAILNDLYVQPAYRGNGYGKELVNNALYIAKTMGFSRLQWLTAEGNETAQKLYNNLGANKSAWFFYAKET